MAGGDGAIDDVDRLSYRLLRAGVTVTKPAATDVKVAADAITKTGIELVEGSPFGDDLSGHGGPDVFLGGGGDDVLAGAAAGTSSTAGPASTR